ncbi:Imm49 family immunity protein [Streptomyces sp. NPDC057284]|uniref:Imm49 family immunity protein n=1 Tax=Streptomyces sp. NPDC057284 TaxID=3346083 RepID=UPI0036394A3F
MGPDRPDRSRGTGGAHRTAYRPVRAPVPTVRTTTTDCPSISPGVRTRLALACHARRRGWEIRVESSYLPQRLLKAAEHI